MPFIVDEKHKNCEHIRPNHLFQLGGRVELYQFISKTFSSWKFIYLRKLWIKNAWIL